MFKLINQTRSAAAVAAIMVTLTVTGFASGQKSQEPTTQPVASANPGTGTGTGGAAPASQYFQTELSINLNESFVGVGTFKVPAGKELVIEYVSASGSVPAGESMTYSVATGSVQHFIPAVQQVPDSYLTIFVAGQQTRLYADPGTTVTLGVIRTGGGGTASATISISGTLVDAQ